MLESCRVKLVYCRRYRLALSASIDAVDGPAGISESESARGFGVVGGLPAESSVQELRGGLTVILAKRDRSLKPRAGGAAELKIQQAKKHFEVFRTELSNYYERAPWTFRPVRDGPDVALVLDAHLQIPDPLALIAGDVLHNLRSALDCIIMEFAELGLGMLGRPPTDREERSLGFPITESSLANRQKRSLERFLSIETVERLRLLQPYETVKAGLTADGYRPDEIDDSLVAEHLHRDLLLKLNTLNNWDKHRRLTFSFFVPSSVSGGTDVGELSVHSSPGELASLFDIPWLGLEAPSQFFIDDPELFADIEAQRAELPEDEYQFHFSWWPLVVGDEIGRYIPLPGCKPVPDIATEASLRLVFFEPDLSREHQATSVAADRLLAEIIQDVESVISFLRSPSTDGADP